MNANKVWTPQYNGIGVLEEKHAAENILDVINSTCC